MPAVDDLLNGLQVQIDKFWYDILRLLAVSGWTLQKGLFMMGHALELMNLWLVDEAFAPLIEQTNAQMKVSASLAFVLALFVLGITYLLAAFAHLQVVNPRSAIAWYLAGAIFFQLGPQLYRSMNTFRQNLSEGFYQIALDNLGTNDSPFSSLVHVQSSDLPPLEACDALGPYLPDANAVPFGQNVEGLDIALAYLRADGQDVMGYPAPSLTACFQPRGALYETDLPTAWQFYEDGYFYVANASWGFDDMSDEERQDSIDNAGAAQFRILSAWPLVIFGVIEQMIFLLLTIAQGLTFVSFSVAILFSFFKRTEIIARSILDLWIELIVQTIVIALMQSLIVSFLLGAAATQNALVILGVSLICAIFITILLWSAVKAVWNSFNRLFGSIGQATGGVMVAPGTVALGATALGTGAALGSAALAANVGSSALAGASALNNGATTSQAAGVMLGGSQRLSAAARTLAYLPSLRGTDLGDAAGEFTEGAMVRQVGQSIPVMGDIAGPLIGAQLLSNRREKRKRDEALSLPAEPVNPDPLDEPFQGQFTPGRPHRMGTFTPLTGIDWNGESSSGLGFEAQRNSSEVQTQVTQVGAEVRSQAGQAQADRERSSYAADMHGEEIEDRLMALGGKGSGEGTLTQAAGRLENAASVLTHAQPGRTQPMLGLMRVDGANNVAGVMGDAIAQIRVQRTLDNLPVAGGADHFTMTQNMARAMGVTPEPDHPVGVQGDIARLGLFGDQALRLGLTGTQAAQVIREVKLTPEGTLRPETRMEMVNQAHATLNTGWDGAQQAVSALQRAAAMIPTSITAQGMVSVPNVTLSPQIQVSLPEHNNLDLALQAQAALAGSQAGT
jgi:hypothetical protein